MLRIYFERTHKRVSQAGIGRLANIPQPVISQIERGRLRPTADQLARLAAVFKVAPDDLLRDVAMVESR